MSELVVGFAGEEYNVVDRLTFGRTADLELDINKFMHRRVGEFVRESEVWWLRNLGSHIHLTLVTNEGKRVELPPRAVQVLASAAGVVRFSAGPANYEISYELPGLHVPDRNDTELFGESTTQFALVFTPREVDFLVTFARPRLEGLDQAMPTYAEVAHRWGVAKKTLDNTVQGIKRKLRESGLARDEPLETLMGLVVRHGLITRDDLRWAQLDADEPRGSLQGPRFREP